jgi:Tol biopolymer transport system component
MIPSSATAHSVVRGILQVFIYSSEGRLLMTLAANTKRGGADSSFWSGRGKYFLRVNSSGGDWKLAVQDRR